LRAQLLPPQGRDGGAPPARQPPRARLPLPRLELQQFRLNIAIKAKAQGDYTSAFDCEGHDLAPVACFSEYRGFLFASLSADVAPLEQYLGDARVFIDIAVDQAEEGLELVPGSVTYTYQGHWKPAAGEFHGRLSLHVHPSVVPAPA